jgi:hypothetical protein
MIFIGCNRRVGFPRYYNHHSRFTDTRIVPRFVAIWWNNLKRKQPAYQILEWSVAYGKPYCQRCMEMFLEDGKFCQFDEFENPTRENRQIIVDRLKARFRDE